MTTTTKPKAATVAKAEPIVTVADIDIALPPKPTRGGNG